MSKIFNSLVALPLTIGTLWGGEQAINPQSAEACGLESATTATLEKPTTQEISSAKDLVTKVRTYRCPGDNRGATSTNGVIKVNGEGCSKDIDDLKDKTISGQEALTTLGKYCAEVKVGFTEAEQFARQADRNGSNIQFSIDNSKNTTEVYPLKGIWGNEAEIKSDSVINEMANAEKSFPMVIGRNCRVSIGNLRQSLAEMETKCDSVEYGQYDTQRGGFRPNNR